MSIHLWILSDAVKRGKPLKREKGEMLEVFFEWA